MTHRGVLLRATCDGLMGATDAPETAPFGTN